MAYFEQFRPLDAQTLYTGSVSSATVGSAIDTTSFGNILVQFSSTSGVGQVQAFIEGSNDQSEWFPILLNPANDLAVTDTITAEGGYQFKTSFQYIRTNVTYVTGTYNITVLGRSGTGLNAADNLAAAFNPDTPIYVSLANLKKDSEGALILSDGLALNISKQGQYIIDTAGYQSVMLTSTSTMGSITTGFGPDGQNFPVSPYWNSASSATTFTNNINQSGTYTTAILGRYMRIVVPAASSSTAVVTVTFKQAPHSLQSAMVNQALGITNLSHIGGSAVAVATAQLGINLQNIGNAAAITGGVTGSLAVGGNIATGSSVAAANPVTVGGVDPGNLVRRNQTDMLGRTALTATSPYFANYNSNSPQANTAYPINAVGAIPATYQQSAALNVQETSQYEGQNLLEIMSQILLELRILNQQIYELPISLGNNTYAEAPERIRQEPSVFNQ